MSLNVEDSIPTDKTIHLDLDKVVEVLYLAVAFSFASMKSCGKYDDAYISKLLTLKRADLKKLVEDVSAGLERPRLCKYVSEIVSELELLVHVDIPGVPRDHECSMCGVVGRHFIYLFLDRYLGLVRTERESLPAGDLYCRQYRRALSRLLMKTWIGADQLVTIDLSSLGSLEDVVVEDADEWLRAETLRSEERRLTYPRVSVRTLGVWETDFSSRAELADVSLAVLGELNLRGLSMVKGGNRAWRRSIRLAVRRIIRRHRRRGTLRKLGILRLARHPWIQIFVSEGWPLVPARSSEGDRLQRPSDADRSGFSSLHEANKILA